MSSSSGLHPLAELIVEAAEGRFPVADGGWRRVPPWRPGLAAVFAFTGHAVMAVEDDVSDATLIAHGVDGIGGAHGPRLIADLAGPDGWIDSIDAVLARRGGARPDQAPALTARPDLAEHPRARHAASIRSDPDVLGYRDRSRSSVAILARGLAGLTELSFELEPGFRGAGGGTALIRDAVSTVPADELIVACAAPGNAASLRALLGAGFVPIGSVQLYRRAP